MDAARGITPNTGVNNVGHVWGYPALIGTAEAIVPRLNPDKTAETHAEWLTVVRSVEPARGASIPMPIPRYPDDITVEWLSSVLSNRGTPVQLSDVDVTAIGTGQTGATYRISATYAGDAATCPTPS